MHTIVTLFAPEMKKSAFFGEWSLHVEQGIDVGIMVNQFMEQLRTPEDSPRQAFSRLLGYMVARPWPQFLDSIKEILEPEEIARFHHPNGEAFYNKLRLLCSLQVEDYWKQFLAEKQGEAKEVLDAMDKLPTGILESKIRSIVLPVVLDLNEGSRALTVEALKKEIKKAFDAQAEGDEWKKGHEGEKPEEGLET